MGEEAGLVYQKAFSTDGAWQTKEEGHEGTIPKSSRFRLRLGF